MQIEETALAGVVILTPKRFGDDRGWFTETWNASTMAALGLGLDFVQDKLVRCTQGLIFDVAVDFRRGSPTFGKWFGVELSPANGRQLLVPKGFLHGFVTRAPNTEVQYKCTDVYAPDCDGGIRWDDPDIGIDWGVSAPILSGKDTVAPLMRDVVSPFEWSAA
jgi:dTDP-4-dehydrorhamnose 3,5-epimerase